MRTSTTGVLIVMGVAACGQPRMTPDAMWVHYHNLGQAQTFVIQGRLDQARAAFERVARSDSIPRLPAVARPYEDRLRARALEGAGAVDLPAAARATAAAGRACGECHRVLALGPRFASAAGWESEGRPVSDAMRRHLWGADRMWYGLIGPSDSAWRAGARALAEPSTYDDLFNRRSDRGQAMRSLADRVREAGRLAAAEDGPDRRAERYGEILATCSTCHATAGVNR